MKIRKKIDPVRDYTEKGNFNLTARKIKSDEMKKYRVFISHSNTDGAELLGKVSAALTEAGVNIAYDKAFLSGGDNFQKVIEDNIHCFAGVVIVTPELLKSDWCNYEIGYFAGKGLNVYLFDPAGLTKTETGTKSVNLNYHLCSYLPAYETLNELSKAVSEASVYSELFINETKKFNKSDFNRIISKSVDTSVVRITSPFFDKDREAFGGCRFGMLVVNFGTFKTTAERGEPCFAVKGAKSCFEKTNERCAVLPMESMNEDNLECVLLNHVLYSGEFISDDSGVSLEFHVPVHRKYGTEFKFIVDVPNNDKLYRLMNIFECAGMNPIPADSCNGGRIYLALPERETQGIFNIRGEFNNNFICPKALVERGEKD